jgi:K+-transporting ATPase A subunit
MTPPTTFAEFLDLLGSIIQSLIPIIVALTLLVFFWGLTKLIRGSADAKAVEEGKELMKWGIVGLFVMISVWGIIALFTADIFGTAPGIPQFPE